MGKEGAPANLSEVVRGEYLFALNYFSITKDMAVLPSHTITVAGYDWKIQCYPRSERDDSKMIWVKFDLTLVSDVRQAGGVFAALTCAPVTPKWKLWLMLGNMESTVTDTFRQKASPSPPLFLMRRQTVTSLGYLEDDSFTVRCTVAVVDNQRRRSRALANASTASPSPELHRHLGELLERQTGADVKFSVSGESFLAHKNILAARSPYFMAKFFGPMKGSTSSDQPPPQNVVIEDVKPLVFKALLHFIYTDTLPKSELRRPQEEAIMMAQHLAVAADCYGMERLKLICEEKLRANMTVGMVATTLMLAEQHKFLELKASCVEFIVHSPGILASVAATQGYKDLVTSCPAVMDELLVAAVRQK